MTSIIWILAIIALNSVNATLLDQLNYYASQSHYTTEIFEVPFSLDNLLSSSLDLALQTCQDSLKWRQWNCPSADFYYRRANGQLLLDREDAFVTAISTAAILYTIAKHCASGIVSECGCAVKSAPYTLQCSDDPVKAEALYHSHIPAVRADDFYSSVRHHNQQAIGQLLRTSLVEQCTCTLLGDTGCLQQACWRTLKPFAQIAQDIRRMYDEAVQLTNAGESTKVVWRNVPLDVLVYSKSSPNYCEPDAVPYWNGMKGRQCLHKEAAQQSAEQDSEEFTSCEHLCHACGFDTHSHKIVVEGRCNCKFTWDFQLHCEPCMSIEQQYYCY